MPASNRADRVAALIKQEISALMARGIKDPRVGMATISDVKVD